MKILPFRNGNTYKWSKLRSLFDFFFPYSKNGKFEFIRAEAFSTVDGKREFYTFRAFFWHYFYTLLNLRKTIILESLKWAESLGLAPNLALQIGAIALDVADTGTKTTTTPLTWSHTCTGSNLLLSVGAGNSATGPTISTPTYNAVSMNLVGSQQTRTTIMVALYFLVAPATGANTVSVGFGKSSGTATCNAVAVSYSGASQTGQPDASGGGNGIGTPTATVTTVADQCWVAAVAGTASTGLSGPNLTTRGGPLTLTDASHKMEYEDTNAAIAASTAEVLSWSGGAGYAEAAGSFSPAAAVASFLSVLSILGAG